MDNLQLTEKDLYCIARQLQSAWSAPDSNPTYGCKYCIYQFECAPPGRNEVKVHYVTVRRKTRVLLRNKQCTSTANIIVMYTDEAHT